jgi:putative endonuclease
MTDCAFVYIMSNRQHTLYVGATADLLHRVWQHKNRVYPNGFTARYNFTRLVYFETTATYAKALVREKQLKAWSRAKKVALIQATNPRWNDLSRDLDPVLVAR